MLFGHVLYTLTIYPVRQIIEVFYLLFEQIFKSPGLAVIGVSLVFTLLCLPLYIVAESWQERERQTQLHMKSGIKRIKKVFHGDEQYMILSTFYRQHHYHPLMALRSSFGLLIQIPFFIAAYTFLAHLQQLKGTPFLFIHDMGKPDALFRVGSFTVNILPVAMTLINIVSGLVYSKGHEAREKIQIFISALLFLVLLYEMPAGLVLYWTMNNLFSAVKNVCYKIPKKTLLRFFYVFACISYGLLAWYLIFVHTGSFKNRVTLVGLGAVIPLVPLLLHFAHFLYRGFANLEKEQKKRFTIFLSCSFVLFFLMGIALPSYVVASSPAEFSNIDSYTTPLFFMFNTLLQAAGFCLFWPICLYFLFNSRVQTGLTATLSIFTLSAVINSFLFSGYYGNISSSLVLDSVPTHLLSGLINIAILAAVVFLVRLIAQKHLLQFLSAFSNIIIVALVAISFYHCFVIQSAYSKVKKISQVSDQTIEPIYSLSQTKKNVIVLFLDRFTSSLFPPVIQEAPELKQVYSGFTYYPNTISYGLHTIVGAPAMLGGYEYRPLQMNERKQETLQKKINEANSTLPRIFNSAGFNITFANPEGTDATADFLSAWPSIKTPVTDGTYRNLWYKRHGNKILPVKSTILKRDFIWFSLFKCVPPLLRKLVYKNNWWSTQSLRDIDNFINAYSALDFLPELTNTTSSKPTFTFIHNMLPHEPMYLNAPDYTVPTDTGAIQESTSRYAGMADYYSAAASIHLVATWLKWMKKNHCYDNTRIIIVADHGVLIHTGVFSSNNVCQVEGCNPILLVKDFNTTGNLKTDHSFMTQADVPSLATEQLIPNAVNPASGKPLSENAKQGIQTLFMNHNNTPQKNGKYEYKTKPADWYTVHDDIFNPANWKKLYK